MKDTTKLPTYYRKVRYVVYKTAYGVQSLRGVVLKSKKEDYVYIITQEHVRYAIPIDEILTILTTSISSQDKVIFENILRVHNYG